LYRGQASVYPFFQVSLIIPSLFILIVLFLVLLPFYVDPLVIGMALLITVCGVPVSRKRGVDFVKKFWPEFSSRIFLKLISGEKTFLEPVLRLLDLQLQRQRCSVGWCVLQKKMNIFLFSILGYLGVVTHKRTYIELAPGKNISQPNYLNMYLRKSLIILFLLFYLLTRSNPFLQVYLVGVVWKNKPRWLLSVMGNHIKSHLSYTYFSE
jgi:hypothetical protein